MKANLSQCKAAPYMNQTILRADVNTPPVAMHQGGRASGSLLYGDAVRIAMGNPYTECP